MKNQYKQAHVVARMGSFLIDNLTVCVLDYFRSVCDL